MKPALEAWTFHLQLKITREADYQQDLVHPSEDQVVAIWDHMVFCSLLVWVGGDWWWAGKIDKK